MSVPPRNPQIEGGGPPSPRWRRPRALLAAAAALAVGGGIALGVLVTGDTRSTPPPTHSTQPVRPSPTPTRIPGRNPHSSPPWGFVGAGWQDYCYRQLSRPSGYAQKFVPDSEQCPTGTTRITGLDQIAAAARAGADVARLPATWGSIQPRPPAPPTVQAGAGSIGSPLSSVIARCFGRASGLWWLLRGPRCGREPRVGTGRTRARLRPACSRHRRITSRNGERSCGA